MAIYNLSTDARFHVLLTGDDDFVVEFAGILLAKGIPFDILPPLDDEDDVRVDDELSIPIDDIDPTVYGQYADHVIADPREAETTYSHIVDLSVETPEVRRNTLVLAASVHPRATVLASTLTSTATELGMMTGVEQRIIGLGLVPGIMSSTTLAEFAPGLNTRPEHIERAVELLHDLGFEADRVEDRVALVQMRVLVTLINEAAFALMEGVASAEDIDNAMKLGVNYPKGLLAWADEIGIPIVTLILDGLHREYGQERYRPCVLLKQYMRAGWNGKSAGRGFYTYSPS